MGLLLAARERGAVAAPPRPSVSADVTAGGGYDTNLFLLVAASPESPTYRAYRGWFARLAPSVAGALVGDDLRLELRLGSDIRQTAGSGTVFFEDAQLSLIRPDLGPVDVRVAAIGGRFDATVDSALRFSAAGGAASAIWHVRDGWRVSAGYRLTSRWFGAAEVLTVERDLIQEGELGVIVAPGANLAFGATLGYLDLRSRSAADSSAASQSSSSLQRPSATVHASLSVGAWTGFVSGWIGSQRSEGATTDLQTGGTLAVSRRLSRAVDLTARYDALIDRPLDAATGEAPFQRHVAMLGLAAHLEAPELHRAAAQAPAPAEAAPSGRTRFRLRSPKARAVSVVGSWNDWAAGAPEQVLRPADQPGAWETWLALPPGSYRFRFVVDGAPVRPPDAERYRADDFGGEDGIVDVGP